jgi:hypothetical protein
MSGAIPPLPQYAFLAWCSVKAQGQLYLLPLVNILEIEISVLFSILFNMLYNFVTLLYLKTKWLLGERSVLPAPLKILFVFLCAIAFKWWKHSLGCFVFKLLYQTAPKVGVGRNLTDVSVFA